MKKNSNRSYRNNEANLVYFANVSARSAKVKKMAKDQRKEKKLNGE